MFKGLSLQNSFDSKKRLFSTISLDVELLRDGVFLVLFLLTLFASHLPTRGNRLLAYEAIFPMSLWLYTILNKNYVLIIKRLIATKRFQILSISMAIFIFIAALSITHSTNQNYGLTKVLGLILDTVPTTIAFVIVLSFFYKRINVVISLFTASGIIFATLVFIYAHDLTFNGSNEIVFWSHNGVGKFLGYAFLVAFYDCARKRTTISIFICFYIFCGIFFVGLRSAFIFVFLFVSLSVIYGIIHYPLRLKKLVILFLTFIFLIAGLMTLKINSPKLFKRYENIITITNENTKDGSFKARQIALSHSFEMFKEKPVLGWGLGGFNIRYHGIDHSLYLPYPHNILLEVFVELGIVGGVFFIIGVVFMLKRSFNVHPYLGIFFVFAFWSSLFVGDISYQKVMFISIALGFLSKGECADIAAAFDS